MPPTRRPWFGRVLVSLSCCLLAASAARAQNPDVIFDARLGQPSGLPNLPPQGAWGEVINVTSRWIVVQNHDGQQFPVPLEDVREFLIRWPYNITDLTRESMVEAVGQTIGSHVVGVNHIDVFEGPNRDLVAPTYNSVLPNNMIVTTLDPGFNRFMNAWDYAGQNLLYGWAYPVPPNLSGIPNRLHVAGNVLALQWDGANRELRIGLPGNNFATIIPDNSGQLTVTQITRGDSRYARKGDIGFMMPLQVTPRGLLLSQLVLYKQMSLAEFEARNPR